jgi:hypothetical protein
MIRIGDVNEVWHPAVSSDDDKSRTEATTPTPRGYLSCR